MGEREAKVGVKTVHGTGTLIFPAPLPLPPLIPTPAYPPRLLNLKLCSNQTKEILLDNILDYRNSHNDKDKM